MTTPKTIVLHVAEGALLGALEDLLPGLPLGRSLLLGARARRTLGGELELELERDGKIPGPPVDLEAEAALAVRVRALAELLEAPEPGLLMWRQAREDAGLAVLEALLEAFELELAPRTGGTP